MITAVDTNVLIDILFDDKKFGSVSSAALLRSIEEGRIVACDIVWAELSAVFDSNKRLEENLRILPLEFSPLDQEAAVMAGESWRRCRSQGGKRTLVVADFFVAGHAQRQCDRLLTRDRGFYRQYFKKLRVIDPTC